MRLLIKRPFEITANEADSTDYSTIGYYNPARTYNKGEKAIFTAPADDPSSDIEEIDYIYEAAANGVTASPLDDPLSWISRCATHKYMAFDRYNNTQTTLAEDEVIEVRITRANALFLGSFVGSARLGIYAEDSDGNLTLIETQIVEKKKYLWEAAYSWTTYFFRVFIAESGVQDTFAEFASQFGAIRARLTALTNGFSVGRITFGTFTDLGQTKASPNLGMMDFSTKETDTTGETYLKQGRYAKRATFDVLVPTPRLDAVYGSLTAVRGKSALFAADELNRFNALSIYGFFRDFSVILSGSDYSDCTIEVEGLT